MEFHAGDFVSCRDEKYFSQLGLKKNSGIVLEVKKNSCKVMFDDFKGGYWLTEEHLTLASESASSSSLFQEVRSLVQLLEAESFDIEKRGKDRLQLSFFAERVTLPQLEELRSCLGRRLSRLEVLPHMMAELLVEVEYQV